MPSPDEATDAPTKFDATAESAPSGGRLRRLRILTTAVILGGITGLAAVVFYYARESGPSLPALDVNRFDEARSQWQANRLLNYDIQIEVKGMQPAVYNVQVRNGTAQQALRNGRPLTQRRTWGTWSVDGMFSTIAADVENLRRSDESAQHATAGSMQLTLGAEFHPQHHYPTRYFRLEQVQFGNNRSVTWEVTGFDIVAAQGQAPQGKSEDDAS